jgi:hypothetical protein
MRRAADGIGAWLLIGAIGWAGIVWIGWLLWQSTPPRAGFDLALLLDAARRVSAGHSPYDPAMVAGAAPQATSLFYSYPPAVAQAMTLASWLPDGVALVLWGLAATLGLGLVGWRLALATGRAATAKADAAKTVALAAIVLPFAVGVLFGNLDIWYGLAFGVLVLAVMGGRATPGMSLAAGIALGAVAVAKLHPASLLVWLLARMLVDRRGPEGRVLAAAAVTGLVIVAASVLVGGIGPWQDYLNVVRAGAGADLVDPRNAGPVSLLGQLMTLDPATLRLAQVAVTVAALGVTVVAAVRVRDPLTSVAIAISASLVVLPVTWYHYPIALVPVALALALRSPASRARIALCAVIADLAVGFLPLLWLAVAVLLVATRRAVEGPAASRPELAAVR